MQSGDLVERAGVKAAWPGERKVRNSAADFA
jgi:hypothetical protein